MSLKLSRGIFFGSVAAAAALGLALSAAAQDYSYDSGNYGKASYGDDTPRYVTPPSAASYGYDSSATVGGVTVTAPRRVEHTATGAEIVVAQASRLVNFSDLDLSTSYGMHELHSRIAAAAADACDQLDSGNLGMVPMDNDSDCRQRAIDDVMSQVNAPQ